MFDDPSSEKEGKNQVMKRELNRQEEVEN